MNKWHKGSERGPFLLYDYYMSKTPTMQTNATLGILNLDEMTENQLRSLQERGHIARRWGAVWGMKQSEFWALTAKGEQLWTLA